VAIKRATIPFFNHGYLIQFKHKTEAVGESNIFLYDLRGQLEHEVAIWPEGTAKLFLASVDVGAGKQLAYSYMQTKNDGSIAAFIALSDVDGKSPTMFSTETYIATQIALASDGSIWAIGGEYASDSGEQKRWNNYDMLRHYSPSGMLLEHFLPRWGPSVSYQTETPAGKAEAHNTDGAVVADNTPHNQGYSRAWQTKRQTYLRSTGTRTVLYDGLNDRICFHDSASRALSCQSITGDYVGEMTLTGFALSDRGDIFASMRAGGFYEDAHGFYQDPQGGLFVLSRLPNGLESEWKAVPGTIGRGLATGDFTDLLGTDGTSLVHRRREESGVVPMIFETAW
jgi:hypothetical protein